MFVILYSRARRDQVNVTTAVATNRKRCARDPGSSSEKRRVGGSLEDGDPNAVVVEQAGFPPIVPTDQAHHRDADLHGERRLARGWCGCDDTDRWSDSGSSFVFRQWMQKYFRVVARPLFTH